MTRSATARSATGWKAPPTPGRSRPRSPSPCSRRWCRCCSWARNGARAGRSRSSAISRAISPRPSAADAGANMPGPMHDMATTFPIPSMPRRSDPRCSTGPSAKPRPEQDRLALVRRLLAVRARKIVPASRGFGLRRGAGVGRRPAHRQLAHGRRQPSAADRQSVGEGRSRFLRMSAPALRSGASSPVAICRPGR